MTRFRKIIFWIHLVCGVVAGIVIAVMCFTGVALAFEKEIVRWFDREPRLVSAAAGNKTLPIDQLLQKAKEFKPEARISSVVIQNDPTEAILLSAGKTENYYGNPYTGEIKPQTSDGSRKFMELMVNWHRWLAAEGDSRPIGKAITGASNLAFLFLAISGLYLWFPRKWSWAAVRSVLTLNASLRGKARDWNWHNAIGFWSAPVLIVLTLTASVISYRWASNLVYTVTGTTPPPAPGAPAAAGSSAPVIAKPTPQAKPLPLENFFVAARREFPGWDQISYRIGGGPAGAAKGAKGASGAVEQGAGVSQAEPARTAKGSPEAGNGLISPQKGEREKAAQPIVLSIRDAEMNPEFTMTQVTFNPYTAEIIKTEGYSDYNTGRKARTWMRFLHTGEALGVVGKAIASIGSAMGLILVYTGFALSWRRFLGRKNRKLETKSGSPRKREEMVATHS
ncbi:MAG: PepSY-associated TM helix domain-containing protein [Verrucomicrobiales bacterium]